MSSEFQMTTAAPREFEKVFIPCAGTGSRLGSKTRFLNKALVSVALKPAISHIIEKIPESMSIVIGLGYLGETVQETLRLAYPHRKFEFVEVSKYEGPGSGLGLTMLTAKEHLQCPFIFWSCDTLFTDAFPSARGNWLAHSPLPEGRELSEFRCVLREGSQVTALTDKNRHDPKRSSPYIGLAGISDYRSFWSKMEAGIPDCYEMGESFALTQMVREAPMTAVEISNWIDTGALSGIEKANQSFLPEEEATILEKDNESIWFVGPRVIKFSSDRQFISKRVSRADVMKGFIPQIVGSGKNVYAYQKAKGTVISHDPSVEEFCELFDWLQNFWTRVSLDAEKKKAFTTSCDDFYRKKTLERIQLFHKNYGDYGMRGQINGVEVPDTMALLDQVNWKELADGVATRFHGDLHHENILRVDGPDKFALIDWRQDFGGIIEYGDIYYDLAKINHGLIINHGIVAANRFHVEMRGTHGTYEFDRVPELQACELELSQCVEKIGLSSARVRTLTALIYLNIAPLHHDPYSRMLYLLGKKMLWECLAESSRRA
jgi:choline kinase